MFGIVNAVSKFVSTVVLDGASQLVKVIKQFSRVERERAHRRYIYCKRRLDGLTRASVRGGNRYAMLFGGSFSVRMPRVSIRSRRAQRIDSTCETIVKEREGTSLAERR